MDKYTVFGSDGSVDIQASAKAYTKALTEWNARNALPDETIEIAVEAVFDRFPGQRLTMPFLTQAAVTELNGEPSQHKTLVARIQSYVSAQCGVGDARNTGRLDIQKGTGGGVLRLSRPGEDIPARPQKSA